MVVFDDRAEDRFNLIGNLVPVPGCNTGGSVLSSLAQSGAAAGDFQSVQHIELRVFTRHEPSVVFVAYEFCGGCTIKGQDGRATGQCFQRHVAKCLGQAGEQKQILTGVGHRQLRVAAHAHEHRFGAIGL